MIPTKIKHVVGYLGSHKKIIGLGDDQHMVFKEGGGGMTPQECVYMNFCH